MERKLSARRSALPARAAGLVPAGDPHVYLFGTSGEGYAITDRQYDHILRIFREEEQAEGGCGMVGVISRSLATVQERIERARSLGFRDFQISLPSWGALNDTELRRFFAETCGWFPDCRFLHYNLGRARRVLGGDDYARLRDRYECGLPISLGLIWLDRARAFFEA